jgi:hypothetical protein
MPRFDLYRNPNPQAAHGLYLDVQSDLVRTATRWCVPLRPATETTPAMTRAQVVLLVAEAIWLLDTPNILAVPLALLKVPTARLAAEDQLRVESALDFMLRGY